ncbi:helix-turn-helix domain-containing protein [Arthrobacter sp. Br18]|uniref:helix-turn-helix transcriptional regulator n=1 Tax=Arthrobacter sp. Br18 TaxID=1312954 RepID=UPI0020A62097|nr:helix-turn-helix domain-containing protein [Arthrobacter sp. Br18]
MESLLTQRDRECIKDVTGSKNDASPSESADAMSTELLTPAQLSEMLGKPERSLAQWRYLGIGPRFVKIGRAVRYRDADVTSWLEAQTRQRTGEQASA